MADDDNKPLFDHKISVILIAMGSASFVVTIYHLLTICFHQQRYNTNQRNSEEQPQAQARRIEEGAASNSVSILIPAYKYRKRNGEGNGDEEDGTCAVCLGDFEEGEDLRTLPECMHSFHLPCIDMWLSSHSSCPVCRADTTPSPAVNHRLPEPGLAEPNAHRSINMVQIALDQNGFIRRY